MIDQSNKSVEQAMAENLVAITLAILRTSIASIWSSNQHIAEMKEKFE